MVSPQEAYDSIRGKDDSIFFPGVCKDYLNCWVFSYLPASSKQLGGYFFVRKTDGELVNLNSFFKITDFIAAPDVSDQVDFDSMQHSGFERGKRLVTSALLA